MAASDLDPSPRRRELAIIVRSPWNFYCLRHALKMRLTKYKCNTYQDSEDQSDMRGIKSGWYAMEDDGDLSSGPFSSHEECLTRITQPMNGSTPRMSSVS
jgi:hypothetical protein